MCEIREEGFCRIRRYPEGTEVCAVTCVVTVCLVCDERLGVSVVYCVRYVDECLCKVPLDSVWVGCVFWSVVMSQTDGGWVRWQSLSLHGSFTDRLLTFCVFYWQIVDLVCLCHRLSEDQSADRACHFLCVSLTDCWLCVFYWQIVDFLCVLLTYCWLAMFYWRTVD